jgi:ABC-type polar amino acid transport system ATPase subunit
MSEPAVILDNVAVSFGETSVFRDVSLTLQRGDVAVVVGESGVGKSTLLRAIAGQGPFTGTIKVAGKHPKEIETDFHVVLVPQQPFLWDHLTALGNVALVRRITHDETSAVARESALKFLEKLEVDEIATRYPFRLSGGEQQRVSLSRGLAAEADIYLFDEITANIDPRRREQIVRLLLDLAASGKTLVIATHDRRFAHQMSKQPLELTQNGLRPLNGDEK